MAGSIAGGAPAWVYLLLVGLIELGVRRLRTRDVPIVVALIPSVAFFVWSVVGASMFARIGGVGPALMTWGAGAAIGTISAVLLSEPRGQRLANGNVRLPGSWLPLATYMTVFVVRFACAAWAAIDPAQAVVATAIAVAVSGAMTARLVVAVARWQPLVASAAMP